MTASDFFTKYNGRSVDFDGYYGYQCMDLWQQYNKEVVGAPSVAAGYAKLVWEQNLYPKDFYTKIINGPNDIPLKGDVIVWSGYVNGGPGHIAISYSASLYNFTSFDQNWNGAYCHFQPHNYNYVYGWLRPKNVAPSPITDAQKLQKIRDLVFGPLDDRTVRIKIREIVS